MFIFRGLHHTVSVSTVGIERKCSRERFAAGKFSKRQRNASQENGRVNSAFKGFATAERSS